MKHEPKRRIRNDSVMIEVADTHALLAINQLEKIGKRPVKARRLALDKVSKWLDENR